MMLDADEFDAFSLLIRARSLVDWSKGGKRPGKKTWYNVNFSFPFCECCQDISF